MLDSYKSNLQRTIDHHRHYDLDPSYGINQFQWENIYCIDLELLHAISVTHITCIYCIHTLHNNCDVSLAIPWRMGADRLSWCGHLIVS